MFPTLADAYDRYIGRYSNQLARQLMSMVGIAGGQRVLDVGCGPGSLTTALVERLGPGSVSTVDPSEPYAKACRTRAPGAGVVVARAQALPFPDGEFDVVLAQLVVNLLDDPEAGVREMARVTLSGGVVAAAVWARDGMPLLRAFWDA
ncbi:MAG: methyltransferase domain-containing protein, partial [Actinomycetota bacterium]|nr:methyltransferase domain-containing protein [Actinomycetota bacterium]